METDRQKRNGGFSLVELIIVIAIMVIIIAVLAPIYLKFVNNAKISSDIQTASELAVTINTEVAAQNKPFGKNTYIDDFSAVSGIMKTTVHSRMGGTYTVYGNDITGVSSVTLTLTGDHAGTYFCYPDPEGASGLTALRQN